VRWLIASFMAIVTLAPLGAGAADLPPAPLGRAVYAPPPAYRAVANWGGFYVGGNVRINFARDRSTFSSARCARRARQNRRRAISPFRY
jgi:hypothetical protein